MCDKQISCVKSFPTCQTLSTVVKKCPKKSFLVVDKDTTVQSGLYEIIFLDTQQGQVQLTLLPPKDVPFLIQQVRLLYNKGNNGIVIVEKRNFILNSYVTSQNIFIGNKKLILAQDPVFSKDKEGLDEIWNGLSVNLSNSLNTSFYQINFKQNFPQAAAKNIAVAAQGKYAAYTNQSNQVFALVDTGLFWVQLDNALGSGGDSIQISTDGGIVAALVSNNTINIFQKSGTVFPSISYSQTQTIVADSDLPVKNIALSPDGQYLTFGTAKQFAVGNYAIFLVVYKFNAQTNQYDLLQSSETSPDGILSAPIVAISGNASVIVILGQIIAGGVLGTYYTLSTGTTFLANGQADITVPQSSLQNPISASLDQNGNTLITLLEDNITSNRFLSVTFPGNLFQLSTTVSGIESTSPGNLVQQFTASGDHGYLSGVFSDGSGTNTIGWYSKGQNAYNFITNVDFSAFANTKPFAISTSANGSILMFADESTGSLFVYGP